MTAAMTPAMTAAMGSAIAPAISPVIGPGAQIDGFRLGELMHQGSMASIYRLVDDEGGGALPLVMKIPRLGPSERPVNVIGFEVCRTVLGALAQSPYHPTLVA